MSIARICMSFAVCLCISSVALADEKPKELIVEINAGDVDRANVPVFFQGWAKSTACCLTAVDNPSERIGVQRDGERLVWMLDKPLKAGESRMYRLRKPDEMLKPLDSQRMKVHMFQDCRVPGRGDKKILAYNMATVQPPEGVDKCYARSGFIHPLYSPEGRILTEAFPVDHLHQHGMFFAWVNTTFEGRDIDFWNQAKLQGDVRSYGGLEDGGVYDLSPVYAQVGTKQEFIEKIADQKPLVVLNEEWQVRAYNRGGKDGYLIELTSTQKCVTDSPLTINEYHYGGFALRGNQLWFDNPEKSGMLTSEGLGQEDGNHTRPAWVDLFGPCPDRDGKEGIAGATIISHPDNFRAPQPVRLHPDKPYFCFSPQVLGEFKIEPGKPYVSRYRIWTHDGPVDKEEADRLAKDYAKPLVAKVVE